MWRSRIFYLRLRNPAIHVSTRNLTRYVDSPVVQQGPLVKLTLSQTTSQTLRAADAFRPATNAPRTWSDDDAWTIAVTGFRDCGGREAFCGLCYKTTYLESWAVDRGKETNSEKQSPGQLLRQKRSCLWTLQARLRPSCWCSSGKPATVARVVGRRFRKAVVDACQLEAGDDWHRLAAT